MRTRRWWVGVVVCVSWVGRVGAEEGTPTTAERAGAAPADTAAETPVTPPAKGLQPGTAAALGGILGLGSGYYYSRSYFKGAAFTLIDFFAISALFAHDDHRNDGAWVAIDLAPAVQGIGAAVLVGSHLIQGFDAPAEARRHNRRHRLGLFGSPVTLSVGTSLLDQQGSPWLDDLWAGGGASRDLAAAMARVHQQQPPFTLRFQLDHPGAMLGWQSSF